MPGVGWRSMMGYFVRSGALPEGIGAQTRCQCVAGKARATVSPSDEVAQASDYRSRYRLCARFNVCGLIFGFQSPVSEAATHAGPCGTSGEDTR